MVIVSSKFKSICQKVIPNVDQGSYLRTLCLNLHISRNKLFCCFFIQKVYLSATHTRTYKSCFQTKITELCLSHLLLYLLTWSELVWPDLRWFDLIWSELVWTGQTLLSLMSYDQICQDLITSYVISLVPCFDWNFMRLK